MKISRARLSTFIENAEVKKHKYLFVYTNGIVEFRAVKDALQDLGHGNDLGEPSDKVADIAVAVGLNLKISDGQGRHPLGFSSGGSPDRCYIAISAVTERIGNICKPGEL